MDFSKVDHAITLKAEYAAQLFTYRVDGSGTKVFDKLTENMRHRLVKQSDLPMNLLVVCNRGGGYRAYGVVRLTEVQSLEEFKRGPLSHRLIAEQAESGVWKECYMIPEDGGHRALFRDRVFFPPGGEEGSATFRMGVWKLTDLEKKRVECLAKSPDQIRDLC